MAVIFFASVGSILIREARSFKDPGGGPGASGTLAQDVGVIGNPADGIVGADTLFKGQKSISDDVGVIGDTSQGITGADTLFKGQKAIKTAVDAIGGGGVSWAGYTSSTYSGNLGQLKGANDKCEANYSWSHWASYDEIMRLGATYPWTQNAWVRDAVQGLDVSGNSGVYVYNYKDGFGYLNGRPDYNCIGWSFNLAGNYWGPVLTDNSSAMMNERFTIMPKTCNLNFVLPCVY